MRNRSVKLNRSRLSRFASRFSSRFATGVAVLLPIVITVVVLQLVFRFLDSLLGPAIEAAWGRRIPGLGLIALILVIFFTGLIALSGFARSSFGRLERLFLKVPAIGTIYAVGKKVSDSFSGASESEKEGFGRVVLVEYPRDNVWSMGFLTGFTRVNGELHAFVYLPTAPLPNSGWMAVIEVARVFDTDLTTQDAMQAVLSSGLANPEEINWYPLPELQEAATR